MFTVGIEVMDEARREVGEGEGSISFLLSAFFFLCFFLFLPHLIEHETASEGRARIQVS